MEKTAYIAKDGKKLGPEIRLFVLALMMFFNDLMLAGVNVRKG